TGAVMTGAWALPNERRAVLLFVNVSDEPVTATLDFDPQRDLAGCGYHKNTDLLHYRMLCNEPYPESTETDTPQERFNPTLAFSARQAVAWEVSW
ncbi:MAG TPA: hypothetical protein VGK81_00630, partial [Anaerolineae bacterium]